MAYPTKLKYHFVDRALRCLICAQIRVSIYLIILVSPHKEALLIPIPILFSFEQQQLYLFGLPTILHRD